MRALLVAVALLVATPVFAHPTFPTGMVRVYIHETDDQFPDSFGSGALVSPTQILTNWHVVRDRRIDPIGQSRSVEIRFADGTRAYASVIKQDKTWDVALLKVRPVGFTPFTVGNSPEAGDKIAINGFGFDYEYKKGTGTRSQGRYYPDGGDPAIDGDFFQLVGYAARRGDSGGPVTDKDGRLIGLLYGSNAKERLTMCVNIKRIRKVFGPLFCPQVTNHNDYNLRSRP
jgi:S1-C subfamily serine protease